MDDNGFEYEVIVRGGKYVSANARYADGRKKTVPEQEIELSQLHRETIGILQDWLNRWGVLSRVAAQYDSLCVPGTFEVLGQHLYNAIFPDPVAAGFDDTKREAERKGAPLRVVLKFEPNGDKDAELASFAWEFLYHPPDPLNAREGFFIGTETDLTLSRLLPFGTQRPELPKGVLPLRVLFILSTPESLEEECARSLQIPVTPEQREEYAKDRYTLIKFLGQFQDDANVLVVRNVYSWDSDNIRKALNETNPNIIHVVGVCRSRNGSGEIEMALPGAGGCPAWQNAEVLVNLLKQAARSGPLALVVLHLCEASRSDYTATFERLAPKLVQAGIPAVLAMQYPVPTTAATSFTQKFYDYLTQGKEIGQAVQAARQSMKTDLGGDRVFGTPVLYLQSVDGQLLRAATTSGTGPLVDVQRGASETLADKLRQVVVRSSVGADTARELDEWIDQIDWTDDREALKQQILARMRYDTDIARHGPAYTDMLAIVEKGGTGP